LNSNSFQQKFPKILFPRGFRKPLISKTFFYDEKKGQNQGTVAVILRP
jgi:hypothetical protein